MNAHSIKLGGKKWLINPGSVQPSKNAYIFWTGGSAGAGGSPLLPSPLGVDFSYCPCICMGTPEWIVQAATPSDPVDRLQHSDCMISGERKWMDGSVGLFEKGKQQWARDRVYWQRWPLTRSRAQRHTRQESRLLYKKTSEGHTVLQLHPSIWNQYLYKLA